MQTSPLVSWIVVGHDESGIPTSGICPALAHADRMDWRLRPQGAPTPSVRQCKGLLLRAPDVSGGCRATGVTTRATSISAAKSIGTPGTQRQPYSRWPQGHWIHSLSGATKGVDKQQEDVTEGRQPTWVAHRPRSSRRPTGRCHEGQRVARVVDDGLPRSSATRRHANLSREDR